MRPTFSDTPQGLSAFRKDVANIERNSESTKNFGKKMLEEIV